MTVKELIDILEDFPKTAPVDVSVDMSTGETDFENRCFGDVYSSQYDGMNVTILAECGKLNY